MKRYSYAGPVMQFGKCVANRWTGETTAVSQSKARNNLVYQYKKEHGLAPNCKITLPGNLVEVV